MPSDLQTTFVIKTFERPTKPVALVKSIEKFYPKVPIIIIDDSKNPLKKKWAPHIQYIHTEYDIGLSEGRNRGVKLVKTKYFVLLDDDFEFTEETKIETFIRLLEKYDFDLIGGKLCNEGLHDWQYTGFLKIYREIFYACIYKEPIDSYDAIYVDFVINFFLAKTDVIQKNLWDPELKLNEHGDFFLTLKDNNVKVGYTPHVVINHWPDSGINRDGVIVNQMYYENRLVRSNFYSKLFFKKRGLRKRRLLNFDCLPFFPSLSSGRQHANSYQGYFLFCGPFIMKTMYYSRKIINKLKKFIGN